MKNHAPYLIAEDYRKALEEELFAQLCVAWEEWTEQHHEEDEDCPRAMGASKSAFFNADEIVIIGEDKSINHYRFTLERVA